MDYTPPFVPESFEYDEALENCVALARKVREDAAARIKRDYAAIKPDTGKWRTDEPLKLPAEPPHAF